jgi:hypothetical protein
MDSSFHEQESGTQEAPKSFFGGLSIFVSLIKWLTGLIEMTEEEREDAGIYLGRPGPGGE